MPPGPGRAGGGSRPARAAAGGVFPGRGRGCSRRLLPPGLHTASGSPGAVGSKLASVSSVRLPLSGRPRWAGPAAPELSPREPMRTGRRRQEEERPGGRRRLRAPRRRFSQSAARTAGCASLPAPKARPLREATPNRPAAAFPASGSRAVPASGGDPGSGAARVREPRAAHGAGPVRGPHLLRPPARLLIPDAVPPPRAGRRPWRRSAPVAAARDASRSRAPSGGGAPARPPRVSGGQCAGPAAAALPPRVRSAPRAGAHAEGGPGLRALPTRAAPRPRAQRSVTVFGNYCRDSYQSPVEPPSSGACPISYMTFLCLTLAF